MRYYTVTDMIDDYKFTGSGHFFNDEIMRFFKSRVSSEFKQVSSNEYLFVTSERGPHHDARVFTVRKATVTVDENGKRRIGIDTMDEYQFTTRARCIGFIKRSQSCAI